MRRQLKKLAVILSVFFITVILPLIITGSIAIARAGGAGGGHGGGGGHFSGGGFHTGGGTHYYNSGGTYSGGSGSLSMIIVLALFFGIPALIIIGIISAMTSKKSGFKSIRSILFQKKTSTPSRDIRNLSKTIPVSTRKNLKKKAESAFVEIQESWSNGVIGSSRRFMTDGVYQRFSSQLLMMEVLKQKDIISEISVLFVRPVAVETDGQYDIIHTAIGAEMNDQFISETDHSLDSPGDMDQFTEIWSFMRKRGKGGKDIYSTNNCPQCSAPLPENLGDAGKCPYCSAFVNNAEYDWVLSEISQSDDFQISAQKANKSGKLFDAAYSLDKDNPDFSIQLLKDKVSNGYIQVYTALALHEPQKMRRFVSDKVFEQFKNRIPKENIVYNRFYLNDVSLLAIRQTDTRNVLYAGVRVTSQRAILEGSRARLLDPVLMTGFHVVQIERDRSASLSKGSVYAHLCPSCGAAVADSLDLKCTFCGSLLNSSKYEWIITGILSKEEYDSHIKEMMPQMGAAISPDLDDSLYDVRDFAFNNIMVIFGADGVFADEEKAMAEELAKKWGYKKS